MIFFKEYGRGVVMQRVKTLAGNWTIIPHGVNQVFRLAPRLAKPMANYSQTSPFQLLYVSNVYPYKHQWNVAEAVHELKQAGFWVELDLVGSAYPPALNRLQNVIQQIDPDGKYIHYHGEISYSECLHIISARMDLSLHPVVKVSQSPCWKRWQLVCRSHAPIVDQCRNYWEKPAYILILNSRVHRSCIDTFDSGQNLARAACSESIHTCTGLFLGEVCRGDNGLYCQNSQEVSRNPQIMI